ncbi:MAG TPA: hypothetical protein VJZ27_15935, partial [Aggregatilineales bacterium]|nr:hypothetical protein [Aggregatilineales bacterium]
PPGLTALLIMDALQPADIFEMWIDPYALAPALGALSIEEPVAVVQVVDNGGFLRPGTAFCPAGQIRVRARMKVKITLPNKDVIQHQLSGGEIWIPAISAGTWVDIDVRVSRGLRLNGKRRSRQKVQAGTAGLIFDLRGRPLNIPSGRRRNQALMDWFRAVTGIEVTEEQFEQEMRAIAVPEALAVGLSDADFPNYKKLPDAPLDVSVAALLDAAESSGADEDFELPDLDFEGDADSAAGEVDSLARELGLR